MPRPQTDAPRDRRAQLRSTIETHWKPIPHGQPDSICPHHHGDPSRRATCRADKGRGGADKKLDWSYAVSPRLARYSIGLREPREILIRFSLYQRM